MSSTELHQLFKVPQLVAHFIHHQKEDGSISFLDFLVMHYNESDETADDQQHEKLPFKSHCTAITHIIVAEVANFNEYTSIEPFTFKKTTMNYKEVFYTSRLTESIWQPPKFA